MRRNPHPRNFFLGESEQPIPPTPVDAYGNPLVELTVDQGDQPVTNYYVKGQNPSTSQVYMPFVDPNKENPVATVVPNKATPNNDPSGGTQTLYTQPQITKILAPPTNTYAYGPPISSTPLAPAPVPLAPAPVTVSIPISAPKPPPILPASSPLAPSPSPAPAPAPAPVTVSVVNSPAPSPFVGPPAPAPAYYDSSGNGGVLIPGTVPGAAPKSSVTAILAIVGALFAFNSK